MKTKPIHRQYVENLKLSAAAMTLIPAAGGD